MGIDKARAEALFLAFGPQILRRCTRLLKSSAEAEDATQEVFLKVCRYLDRLPKSESGLPWVHRIATTVCLNRIRGQARLDDAVGRAGTAQPVTPENFLEDRRQAQQLLARCDERTGLIACWHFVDGMTQEEISAALGISRRTVYADLQRFLELSRSAS